MTKTQCEQVWDYMEQHGSITTLQAYNELGVTRLPSRICDLRKQGRRIDGRFITVRRRDGSKASVKQYSIMED